ncbi:SDR family NAD(P)-dependent oxidoreductase [Vibrio fluvialis]|nr:SDR family NAD(P)-dependent oxidoreductase [Vibrio fluvialis]
MMINTEFNSSSTSYDVIKDIDLTSKRVIVTGGASGIGRETVRTLAMAGANVTIAARRPKAAEEVASELRADTGNSRIEVRSLDLADLQSVRAFVSNWNEPLDILINNAGIMALPTLERTSEGREMQFGTNFIGHFALTLGLHRYLKEANEARVVFVASSGNLFGPVLWDDIDFSFLPYDPLIAYAQSKTACILLSVAISRKWHSDGITSNALNPGAIATNLQRHTGGLRTPERYRKTLAQGAATTVLLACSPSLRGVSGRYFDDCNEAPIVNERPNDKLYGVASYALDPQNADRLWDIAIEWVQ